MVETRNKGKSQASTQPSKKAKPTPKRQQPVKPNPNAPPPPSVNHRFNNNAARDRFRDIRGYRVIPERGFDFPKLISNPEFFQQANKTLGIEFYANARLMGQRYVSFVRGKEIDYSPEKINALLEIVPPEECGVKRMMEECKDWSDERWEELLLQLCVEGAKWQGGSHMLLKADFKPYAKAWASFVVQTLEGTSCTSEIPLARLLTVSAILDGLPINVGELIANNIYMFASGTKKAIPHLSLINWLCESQDCDLFANDLSAAMMKPLNDTYLDSFTKDYQERLHAIQVAEAAAAGQPEPQPVRRSQPPPTQTVHGEGSSQQGAYAPLHPMMLDYMFGHAIWMNEVSAQEYWNRPRFGQEFTEAVCLNRRAMTGSFERFDGSEEAMDNYFNVTRGRAQDREQEIRNDFAAGSRQSRYHLGEDTFAEENRATWIPEDQMQD
ncbi:hypothetical protein MTR_7g070630 [Medicago truncatula]|uniref:Putative plant transposon protein domain-containing protein n=1 Tax=Medicago truncatula TaxID=3880 RepID=G7KU60_MEDTR|nr:hypothetical protein MTR_7g070630 [Medicago truncatula]